MIHDEPGLDTRDGGDTIGFFSLVHPQPLFEFTQFIKETLIVRRGKHELRAFYHLFIIVFSTGCALASDVPVGSRTGKPLIKEATTPLKIHTPMRVAFLFPQYVVDRHHIPEILVGLMGTAKYVKSFILIDHCSGPALFPKVFKGLEGDHVVRSLYNHTRFSLHPPPRRPQSSSKSAITGR